MTSRFVRAARVEFDAAIDWYAERSPIAASRFAAAVQGAIRVITTVPRGGKPWAAREDVRTLPVAGFPYVVAYRIESQIIIVAIAHTRRRAGYWAYR